MGLSPPGPLHSNSDRPRFNHLLDLNIHIPSRYADQSHVPNETSDPLRVVARLTFCPTSRYHAFKVFGSVGLDDEIRWLGELTVRWLDGLTLPTHKSGTMRLEDATVYSSNVKFDFASEQDERLYTSILIRAMQFNGNILLLSRAVGLPRK